MTKGKSTTTKKGKLPAGVRFIKSGRYEKRFTVGGVRYSVYGDTVRKCLEKETEKRMEIAAGTYRNNSSITLNDYFKEWEKQKAAAVSPATMHLYRQKYGLYIRKPLGGYKVKDIERRQIQGLLSKIADSVSIYTANSCKALLSQIFKSACYDEIITHSAMDTIPSFKDKGATPARETIHRALTDKEIAAFMSATGKTYYGNAFRFMLATGLRAGECAALEWQDIDTAKGLIHVRRTTTRDMEGKIIIGNTTKTKKSRRDIPLNREMLAILAKQEAQNTALFGNVISINGLVFPNTKGGAAHASLLNTVIEETTGKYNRHIAKGKVQGPPLEPFTVHAFRDTFASKAAAAGVPLNVLKELLGHSSYAMTADLYGHIYEEQKKAAMENLKIVTM